MRLDLSRQQIEHTTFALECHTHLLEEELKKQEIYGLAENTIRESLTIEKSTLLYLKYFLENKS